MKQNKTKPYQACFLSTYDIVSKDKNKIKRDTLTKLYNQESMTKKKRFVRNQVIKYHFKIRLYNTVIVLDIVITN
jgi:hypothetical protein